MSQTPVITEPSKCHGFPLLFLPPCRLFCRVLCRVFLSTFLSSFMSSFLSTFLSRLMSGFMSGSQPHVRQDGGECRFGGPGEKVINEISQ